MNQVRSDKGIQISLYGTSTKSKKDWTLKCEELAARRLRFIAQNGEGRRDSRRTHRPTFNDFLTQAWMERLSCFNAVGFGSIIAAFDGLSYTAPYPCGTRRIQQPGPTLRPNSQRLAPTQSFGSCRLPRQAPEYRVASVLNDFRTVFLSEGLGHECTYVRHHLCREWRNRSRQQNSAYRLTYML